MLQLAGDAYASPFTSSDASSLGSQRSESDE